MISVSADHLLSCLAQSIFQATVMYCRIFFLKDNPFSKTGSFLVSWSQLVCCIPALYFVHWFFFFRSASSCLCRPHRRRNVSQVNLTTETFSLHIFPAYSTQFFLKTPSFSLSPDYRTFVSGACDASAKVKSSFTAQIIMFIISFSSGMFGMGSASRLSLATSLTSMLSQWVWFSTLLVKIGYNFGSYFLKPLELQIHNKLTMLFFATTMFHVLTTFSFAVLPQWERVRHWVRRRHLQALRHQSWSRAQHGTFE